MNGDILKTISKNVGEAMNNFCKELMEAINVRLPQRYIINKNAGVLFWQDGTKTIVRRTKGDKHDKRVAFLTAYFQKMSGLSKNQANKYLDSLVEEDEKGEK